MRVKWLDKDIHTPKHYREKKVSIFRTIGETLILVLIALLVSGLVKAFLFQIFEIPTGSMERTLNVGDRIVVSKLYPKYREIHRGDIVVFKDSQQWLGTRYQVAPSSLNKAFSMIGLVPDNSDSHLVKRIIGLPGDRVVGIAGKGITVNGVKIDEQSYLFPGAKPTDISFDVTVPKGKIWVMGDNRANSEDSRFHQKTPGKGFVPISDITGIAVMKVWPLNSVEFFPKMTNFDKVKSNSH